MLVFLVLQGFQVVAGIVALVAFALRNTVGGHAAQGLVWFLMACLAVALGLLLVLRWVGALSWDSHTVQLGAGRAKFLREHRSSV